MKKMENIKTIEQENPILARAYHLLDVINKDPNHRDNAALFDLSEHMQEIDKQIYANAVSIKSEAKGEAKGLAKG